MKVEVAVIAAVAWLPDVALLPLHAPEAVHEVALVDDHVSVELPPLSTVVGLAERLIVGAGVVGASATQARPSEWKSTSQSQAAVLPETTHVP